MLLNGVTSTSPVMIDTVQAFCCSRTFTPHRAGTVFWQRAHLPSMPSQICWQRGHITDPKSTWG